MQKINWEMMTQFVFPEQLGAVEEVLSVDIKPVWQQVETEDSVRLVGIYHIAATARFNPDELPVYRDGTFVEELELEGNNGYFEYALPLEVDLPREKVAYEYRPQICINDVSYFVYDGSNCTFRWNVDCQFDKSMEGALFRLDEQSFAGNPDFREPALLEESPEEMVTVGMQALPEYIVQEPPLIEVAPAYDDIPQPNDAAFTEEIHFGGADGIFPEESQMQRIPESHIPEFPPLTKGQPSMAVGPVEEQHEDKAYEIHDSTSKETAPASVLQDAALRERHDESESGLEYDDNEEQQAAQSRNHYFPTDADDFYSELTESFTLLNVSNRPFRE